MHHSELYTHRQSPHILLTHLLLPPLLYAVFGRYSALISCNAFLGISLGCLSYLQSATLPTKQWRTNPQSIHKRMAIKPLVWVDKKKTGRENTRTENEVGLCLYKATLWLPFCNNCAALHSINKLLKRSYKTQTKPRSGRENGPGENGKWGLAKRERYVMVREIAQQQQQRRQRRQQRLIMTINTQTYTCTDPRTYTVEPL